MADRQEESDAVALAQTGVGFAAVRRPTELESWHQMRRFGEAENSNHEVITRPKEEHQRRSIHERPNRLDRRFRLGRRGGRIGKANVNLELLVLRSTMKSTSEDLCQDPIPDHPTKQGPSGVVLVKLFFSSRLNLRPYRRGGFR